MCDLPFFSNSTQAVFPEIPNDVHYQRVLEPFGIVYLLLCRNLWRKRSRCGSQKRPALMELLKQLQSNLLKKMYRICLHFVKRDFHSLCLIDCCSLYITGRIFSAAVDRQRLKSGQQVNCLRHSSFFSLLLWVLQIRYILNIPSETEAFPSYFYLFSYHRLSHSRSRLLLDWTNSHPIALDSVPNQYLPHH